MLHLQVRGDELDSALQLYGAIYSARLGLSTGLCQPRELTREVRPVVLVKESSTQLLMYSLDTDIGMLYTHYTVPSRKRAPGRY